MPGILAWAVRGCVEWVEHGLGSSIAVDAATAAYRAETDLLEQFFQERCYFYPEAIVSISDLFEAWEKWCDETGEDPGSKRKFAKDVRERGGVKNVGDGKIGRDTRAFTGISVSPSVQSRDKSPANVGVVKDIETENLNSQELLGDTPRVERFLKNDEFQSPVSPESSLPPLRTIISTPRRPSRRTV